MYTVCASFLLDEEREYTFIPVSYGKYKARTSRKLPYLSIKTESGGASMVA